MAIIKTLVPLTQVKVLPHTDYHFHVHQLDAAMEHQCCRIPNVKSSHPIQEVNYAATK